MKNRYHNYFKNHYKSTFSERDIFNYRKWFYSQYHFIESRLKIKPEGNILEIGSGFGGFYSFLSKDKQKNYLGLELDTDSANFANSFFDTEVFLNKSLEEFGVKKVISTIYAFEVLEHLDNPIQCIKKIADLLHNEGTFIGSSPYPYKKMYWRTIIIILFFTRKIGDYYF
jgi:2-polyprenyl-3-methyl-5-hydroxy-6-metoxy-1,4-benzoquinol methylase